jgi:4-amino-4-deoxy-L-arabinose transferase-like glycosyltransferase
LIAAVLQAVLIARLPTISADGIIFITIAQELPQGAAETFRRHDQHPGYPAMLLAATRVVQWLGYESQPNSWIIGGLAVSYVCGLLSVWAVWLVGRDLFGLRAANLAALGFAVLPLARINAADAQSDTAHLVAYLLAAWLASSAIASGRLIVLAGAGVASGIAYWIRPEGLEVFFVAMVCLALHALRARWAWRRMVLAGATLGVATLIVAAPYPIMAGKITSKQIPFAKTKPTPTFIDQLAAVPPPVAIQAPTPAVQAPLKVAPPTVAPPQTTTSTDSVVNTEPVAVPVESQPANVSVAPPLLAAQPPSPPLVAEPKKHYSARLLLRLLGHGVLAFAVSLGQGFKFVFVPFYLIGHIELFRRKPEAMRVGFNVLLGLTHFCILLAVYILSGYIAHRHVLPIVALMMPCAALGVICVGEAIAGIFKVRPAGAVLATLAISCAIVLPYTLRPVNREFLPVLEATRWVQSHADPGSGIVCNSPYVSFYGTLPVAFLGDESATVDDVLAKAATTARYDFVVLHVNAHGYRPEWIAQLEPHYLQVQLFPDPNTGGRPKKVLVFQARDAQVRQAAHHTRP